MKICHVCQNITKITHCVSCFTCKRSFCFPCISKYFPEHKDRFLPKNPADTLKQIRTKQCLYCLHLCRCLKCSTSEAIVPTLGTLAQPQQSDLNCKLGMEEALQDSALFAGKKVTQIPTFLQRILNKKKVIYSKHQLSVPANEDIPEQPQVQHHEETQNKEHSRREEGMLGQSADLRGQHASEEAENNSEQKMKAENEGDQADIEQEEEHSRSGQVSGEVGSGSKIEAEGEESEEESQEEIPDQNQPRQSQEPCSENAQGNGSVQQGQPEKLNGAHSGQEPKGQRQ